LRATLSILLLIAITFGVSARAPGVAAKCDVHRQGTLDVEDDVVRVRKKPRIELVRDRGRDTVTGALQATYTVRQGTKSVTELVVEIAPGGATTVTRRYGLGFKGFNEAIARKTAARPRRPARRRAELPHAARG
jgi:hypothetical protein